MLHRNTKVYYAHKHLKSCRWGKFTQINFSEGKILASFLFSIIARCKEKIHICNLIQSYYISKVNWQIDWMQKNSLNLSNFQKFHNKYHLQKPCQ